jgi:hypothetical protein
MDCALPRGDPGLVQPAAIAVSDVDLPQRRAARVAGFMYLFLVATAGLAEFWVRGDIVVPDDAEATVVNIAGDERMFRLGIAVDLVAAPGNVLLAVALYVLLRPVHPHLALVAALWRVGEATILGVITLMSFVTLELLDDAVAPPALAGAFIGAHADGYAVGLIFFGLGSTVFGYLLYRSGYVPRALGALGVFASLVLVACMYAIIVFPDARSALVPACYAPIGIFELALGVWLLARPLPPQRTAGTGRE